MEGEESRTLWCGNLSDRVTIELLEELFLQAGPLERVNIPKDRDGRQRNYAFIIYVHSESVSYALNIFQGTCLFERSLNLQFRGGSKTDKKNTSRDYERDTYSGRVSPRHNDMLKLNHSHVQQFIKSAEMPISEGMFQLLPPPGVDNYKFSNDSSINDLSKASLTGQWSSKKLPVDRYEPYKRDSKYNKYKELEHKNNYDKYIDHKHYRDRNNDRHKSKGKNHRNYFRN